MRKIFFISLVTLFFSVSLSQKSNSQNIKLGFVNSAKILDELPEAQDAQNKLDDLGKKWQDDYDRITKEYQTKGDEYQKKSTMLNEEAKRKAQQDLMELEQKAYEFRQQKLGQGGELDKQKEKYFSPIKDKVLKAIETVAKDEGVQFVFDKNDNINFLLYGDNKFDLTYKVLDKLKRGK